MKLTTQLLRDSLITEGYTDEEIKDISLTKDYTNSDNTPEINMFSIHLQLKKVGMSTLLVLTSWSKKIGYEIRDWYVTSKGWQRFDERTNRDSTNKVVYFVDGKFKFRRIEE